MNPKPWERQPGESGRWHARFVTYCTMGAARSIDEVWRRDRAAAGKRFEGMRAGGRWTKTAQEWRWRERAEAWDAEQEALAFTKAREDVEKMLKRHTDMALMAQRRVVEELRRPDLTFATAGEAVKALEVAVRVERLARGVADTAVHVDERRDAGALPGARYADGEDERAERISALLARVAARNAEAGAGAIDEPRVAAA